MRIATVVTTGSTNADLLAAAQAGAADGTWLRAERQTGGRGRAGRTWVSPPGNLYASNLVRLRPGDPPASTLALLAAVALDEAVSAHTGAIGGLLKWPNDLMIGSAKLAGILLERAGDAVVIGYGVNLSHHPADIGRPTTSIAAACGHAPDPGLFLPDLADSVSRWLARWRGEGAGPVLARWLECAHPIGTALEAGGQAGLFDGIEADGALRLRLADGRAHVVRAGDVFLL